jgi:hypothetical protein
MQAPHRLTRIGTPLERIIYRRAEIAGSRKLVPDPLLERTGSEPSVPL